MIRNIFNALLPAKDPQAFTREVEAYILGLEQNFAVKVVDPLHLEITRPGEAEPLAMYLQNVYTKYLHNRRLRKQLIAHYVQTMTTMDTSVVILPKNIVPTIRDAEFIQEINSAMQVRREDTKPDNPVVSETYNDQLVIVYAVDLPTAISYLNENSLKELNLNGETLRDLAVANLRRIIPGIQITSLGDGISSIQAGDMYESSLILFDLLWKKKEQIQVVGDIIIAVPSRETLLIADSHNPASVPKLRKLATKIARGAPYRLTKSLFIWKTDRFELFEE